MRINLLLKFTAFVREPCRHFYFWTLARRRTYGAFVESENRIKKKKKPHHPYAVATLIIAIIATPPPFTPPFLTRHPILLAMHERYIKTLMTRGALSLARKIMTDGGFQYYSSLFFFFFFIYLPFSCVYAE